MEVYLQMDINPVLCLSLTSRDVTAPRKRIRFDLSCLLDKLVAGLA